MKEMKKSPTFFRAVMVLSFSVCLVEARAPDPEPQPNESGYVFTEAVSIPGGSAPSASFNLQYMVMNTWVRLLKLGTVSLLGLRQGEINIPTDTLYISGTAQCKLPNNEYAIYFVIAIGQDAFKNCAEFKTILLPHTIDSIGENAFSSSTIESITWYREDNNSGHQSEPINKDSFPPALKTIGAQAFQHTPLTGSLTIGDSVKAIGASAFDDTDITELVITWAEEGTMEIAANAFSDCASLEKLTITSTGGGTVTLAKDAFANCTALNTINFEPEEAVNVDPDAFPNVPGWTSPEPNLTIQEGDHSLTDVNKNDTLRACLVVGETIQPVHTGVTWTELKPLTDPNRPDVLVLRRFLTETDSGVVVYPLYGTVQTVDIEAAYEYDGQTIRDTVTLTLPVVTVTSETDNLPPPLWVAPSPW
jgi:hypothetical protein